MMQILHHLKDLNYGNYGIFLTMGNAGFISSTVGFRARVTRTEESPGVAEESSFQSKQKGPRRGFRV